LHFQSLLIGAQAQQHGFDAHPRCIVLRLEQTFGGKRLCGWQCRASRLSRDGFPQNRRWPRQDGKADHFHQIANVEVPGRFQDKPQAVRPIHQVILAVTLMDNLARHFHPFQRAGL